MCHLAALEHDFALLQSRAQLCDISHYFYCSNYNSPHTVGGGINRRI